MKTKFIFLSTIFLITFSLHSFAQWPGNFYAFILKDSTGKIISDESSNYKFTVINDSVSGTILSIKVCDDNKTWRFYEGGNHYMGTTQKLKIEYVQANADEVMIIEFPPSLSAGKEQYYRNLYAGSLKFIDGVYIIKLPQTDEQWDKLQETKLCPDKYNNYSIFDVSEFQK